MVNKRPTPVIGNAYFTTRLSSGKSATSKIMARGNINMRWYQHNTHGMRSITSLKNKLPSVDIAATSQAAKINVQLGSLVCELCSIQQFQFSIANTCHLTAALLFITLFWLSMQVVGEMAWIGISCFGFRMTIVSGINHNFPIIFIFTVNIGSCILFRVVIRAVHRNIHAQFVIAKLAFLISLPCWTCMTCVG